MRIYLAGPDVFLPDARTIGERKKAICRQYGFDGAFPLDDTILPEGTMTEVGHAIFDHCVAMMDRCDLAVANMTPWRGVSMDVGTAVEVGYLYARGRPVFGYTNVAMDLSERVAADGYEIEAFGFHDNLMCEGPVWRSGGEIVRTTVKPGEEFTDVRAFEACVKQARQQADAGTDRRR